MEFVEITSELFDELKELQKAYKAEIGEEEPTQNNLESLYKAISNRQIVFYGCICEKNLIACCSIFPTYSDL